MADNENALINDDLAPTTAEQRTWTRWDIAALWVGMSICIPTYGLAAGLVAAGGTLGIVLTAIALGNIVVLVPMILNAHAGTKYGIPFPVLLRSSFGVLGSNIPALIRAMVACGWFGIQTWIGGFAIYTIATALFPSVSLPNILPGWFGINTGQFIAFTIFWIINVTIIIRGMETLRVLEKWAAPFLIVMGLALFVWAWVKVGSLGEMLADPAPTPGQTPPSTWSILGIGLTSAVAFWGTLALNIPDFARYAKNQKEQIVGQSIGLPPTMTVFVFIGAAVTNASLIIFGTRISDPVQLIEKMGSPFILVLALMGIAIATLSTNLAANIVSPANDFSNLSPRRISFKKGALIAATIGFIIMPWKLWIDAQAYIMTWLLGYGALLGAVGGIMIVDYYVLRGCKLNVDALYQRGGEYEYRGGFNPLAIIALLAGVALNIPGFLSALGVAEASSFFAEIYNWGWFVSFFIGGTTYWTTMKLFSGNGNDSTDASVVQS
jgi:NCS1 family nucleobase:cation symporter-1